MHWKNVVLFNNPFGHRHWELRSVFSEDDFFAPRNLNIEFLAVGPAQLSRSTMILRNKAFSDRFFLSRFMRITFNCSQLEFGISQANAIKVQLKSDSNRSAVLDSPTNIQLGRSYRSNFLMWVCERAASSENLSVWGVVTLTFYWFPICVWIHPKTFMERLVWLVHFNFNSEIQEFLGFEPLESAIQLFHIMILHLPSYASNC